MKTITEKYKNRKNPRLKYYDYTSPNYYFITICSCEKKHLFGFPKRLNKYGQIAEAGIIQIPTHFDGVRIDKFVVMPNHVHMILVLSESKHGISIIISRYKAYVTKMIHEAGYPHDVWQRSFHDHIIRNETAYEKIWNYIDGNPQNWETDCFHCMP